MSDTTLHVHNIVEITVKNRIFVDFNAQSIVLTDKAGDITEILLFTKGDLLEIPTPEKAKYYYS